MKTRVLVLALAAFVLGSMSASRVRADQTNLWSRSKPIPFDRMSATGCFSANDGTALPVVPYVSPAKPESQKEIVVDWSGFDRSPVMASWIGWVGWIVFRGVFTSTEFDVGNKRYGIDKFWCDVPLLLRDGWSIGGFVSNEYPNRAGQIGTDFWMTGVLFRKDFEH